MDELIQTVRGRFPQRVLASHQYRGQQTVLIRREGLLEIARALKDDPSMAFDFLMDLSCVDYLKFGKSQASAPTMSTPSPLPYYMKPKTETETWTRLPAAPQNVGGAPACPPGGLVAGRQAGGFPIDDYRFEAVYHFYSSTKNHRLRIKVPLAASDPVVDSLTGLWHAADWFEREAWDMFGVRFTGHPNLKRLLMYEEFKGHPLRKDYPVRKRQPLIGPVN